MARGLSTEEGQTRRAAPDRLNDSRAPSVRRLHYPPPRQLVNNTAKTACFFFFSSRRRHTRCSRDWSSDGVLFRSQPTMTIMALAFRAADRITALAKRGELGA